MAKIVVVYHSKTKKIVPFKLDDKGCIIVLTNNTRKFNEDTLRVRIVDVRDVNFESGYLEERVNGNKKAIN